MRPSARSPAGTRVIDVREPNEWDESHLEGAIHVPQARGRRADRRGRAGPLRAADPPLPHRQPLRADRRPPRRARLRERRRDRGRHRRVGATQGYPLVYAKGLTPEQRNRYSRHTLLPEVGVEGQVEAAERQGAPARRRRARLADRSLPRRGRHRHDRDRRRRRGRRVEPPAPGDPHDRPGRGRRRPRPRRPRSRRSTPT